ncbi:unnamed protein product [Adineta steineri]|uniref:Uncharacterized protein n=1 Tax=Adineta steineri TaxID=433720 RepID=A0A815UFH5_9BILA|nr:unnamed protein product [Adineta steineri]
MKFVLVSLIISFFLITKSVNGQTLYPSSSGCVGAVYTMSNGADMNQILINCLDVNGNLKIIDSINTNGTGVNTTNIDPLYSQGSLTVYSNYLFAVNPGSNSLSMFLINPSDGTQLTLLSVQSTYGLFPISVTVNNMYACVLTGGSITGIRCFNYNSSGLFLISSFDRNLTSYISQTIPPNGPPQTMSEILFSTDNLALIISVKGSNTTYPGYLLFYTLSTNMTILAPYPTKITPTNGALPFSMTLVGMNGLLITDPGANGVLTLQYSSTAGMISNSMFTPINTSLASALCWSTYSPNIGNYYVIAAVTATIVELNINMNSMTNPVQIIQYYPLPNNTGALEATVVSLSGKDYLYILGTTSHVISGYSLNSSGNAIANSAVVVQQGDTTTISKLAGIAAFVQTQSGTNSAMLHLSSTFSIMITIILIFISFQ